jgi:uncharacterized membrane protein
MKTAISSALRKPASLFRRIGGLFSRIGPLLRRIGSPFRKLGPFLSRIGPLFWKIGPLFTKVGSGFRKASSLLSRLVRKIWALPPFRGISRVIQRTRKEPKRLKYRFLPYVTSVLRVLGWAVLIIGVLASIVLGLEIINGGLMVWETELRGVGMGVSTIVLGVIGSFLAWLFLLVSRELVCLFIHVKENTRNTAESVTE